MSLEEFETEFEALTNSDDDDGLFDVPLDENSFSINKTARFGLRFSFGDLEKDFADKVQKVLGICEEQGYLMVPYFGLRDPWEQARLWRQSRSTTVVNEAIAKLKSQGADFLAAVLRDVGPQGPDQRVTNALPGYSWHQYGNAVDVYRSVGGAAAWSCDPHYKVYAETARDLGLTSGYFWSFKDCGHIQAAGPSSPGKMYSAKQINNLMVEKFGKSSERSPLTS
ncbi:M15 family metallopeptidase [Paracoccus sp. SCSIO 75233]|uniref:M15 family metallopeptidase n=1 Tax=Paracoccus sp. SCSIO 75233 TaxID=3017782 RepID=UPI0022F0E8D1|nr:M15 family metallopeptidase [Paracoccus sp. SCSIO 75233]WBU51770.1 M15 family metallopeptidase [Paracoccus sp. SCSIO 75233]